MSQPVLGASSASSSSPPNPAHVQPFPSGFSVQEIEIDGAVLYVRIGGQGGPVLLLHGYAETGDMWAPLAAELARDHTVIVPDLRGLGLSARPEGGYDKKTQGRDIAGLLDALKVEKTDLVTHDIGNMVGYAFAAQYRGRVTRFVVMMRHCRALAHGTRSCEAAPCGTSPFRGRTPNGSSQAASGSISTASGTSLLMKEQPTATIAAVRAFLDQHL